MHKRILLAGLMLLTGWFFYLMAQQRFQPVHDWYQEANRLYLSETPNEASDSTALVFFHKVISGAGASEKEMLLQSLIRAGNIHQGYRRYIESDKLYHRALQEAGTDNAWQAARYEACLYLGSSHFFNNYPDSAQYYFETASDLADAIGKRLTLPELDRLYNSLGATYFESANYRQAINYFLKALQSANPQADDYEEFYLGVRNNLANCLMKEENYDSALALLSALDPSGDQALVVKQNMAQCLFELGHYDSAMAMYKRLPDAVSYNRVIVLTNLGRIYMHRKEWSMAEYMLDSAIAVNKRISVRLHNKEEALAYYYRGCLAWEQGLHQEALQWIHAALQEISPGFTEKSVYSVPDSVNRSVSPPTLLRILHQKGRFLFAIARTAQQPQALKAAVQAYSKTLETAAYLKRNFDNDEASLHFQLRYKDIYQEALAACYEALPLDEQYTDLFIRMMDQYKGNVLYKNIRESALKKAAGIPDSVLQEEKRLRSLIGYYSTRVNITENEQTAEQLLHRLTDAQVALSRLQQNMSQDDLYHSRRWNAEHAVAVLKPIREKIGSNQSLISFIDADSVWYAVLINQQNQQIHKHPVTTQDHRALQSLLRELYYQQEGKRFTGYHAAAHLYQSLIGPLEKKAASTEQWIMMPDGRLQGLPFDVLITGKANERNYLLHSKIISYHYSLSLFMDEQYSGKIKSKPHILGMAPFTYALQKKNREGWPVLTHSAAEIPVQSKTRLLGKDAHKTAFVQTAASHDILHLATHASMGNDSVMNYIQFYPEGSADFHADDRLYLNEIYALSLQQQPLVILSACETGSGETIAGEGLMSLSRAFHYAGASGVVSTLWRTEDRVSAYLMKRFYHHHGKGYSPAKALTLAKRDLLREPEPGYLYISPNYWANFVYTGQMQEPQNKNTVWVLWIFLVLLGGAGIRLLYKRFY